MSRGKKLDIFIGADIKDDWNQIQSSPKKIIPSNQILAPQKHQLYFSKEKRRGKTVTLVGEFQLSKVDAAALLKKLKKKLGCGGSYKENFMEFQGELKEKLKPLLVVEEFRIRQGH